MSIKVMTYVWEHSEASGTELLCLLAIADHANDAGEAYPGVSRIARKCRVGERAIQKVLRKLQDSGELEVKIGYGLKTTTGHTNRYALLKYQQWVNGGTPLKTRGELQDTTGVNGGTPLGVNGGTPLGVNVGTPKPSVVTVSKTSEREVSAQSEPVDQPVQPLAPLTASAKEKKNVSRETLDGQNKQQQPPPKAPPQPPPGFRFTDADVGAGPKPPPVIDPRQLQDGLYPAGSGKTPYQVYREAFAVTPTKIQIRHMNVNVADLDKWRDITLQCALRGFKSYDNVFKVYTNGFDRNPNYENGNSSNPNPVPLDVDWTQFGSL